MNGNFSTYINTDIDQLQTESSWYVAEEIEMLPLEKEIQGAFGNLLEKRGFRKTFEHYDDQHFGNEVLIYASPELSLKFVRDRGEILVDLGPSDETVWYMAPRLYEFMELANDLYGPADAALLRRHARLLDEKYDLISDLFGYRRIDETKNELRKFWKLKAEQMFPDGNVGEHGAN